ncbi:hypothetical protein PHET_02060 [Paragonimus heterotremus]|uniref:Cortactin-binding protein-2 N-terminal domain-containing protein n=1 Tax=Paragonimus heterotremus TaxID=100268 RepID=A0A8J4WJ00_9TREM|nr:hypothetical protein PHET_02060 [Paragonimus heterotremus]
MQSMNDLSKEDLFRLLACLQSELEAREEVLKILKHEKLNGVDFRAKYGASGCLSGDSLNFMDPFQALQRDSFVMPVASSEGENALKNLYDSQLVQLEHLITSQKHAQTKMKEHLLSMEQKYRKTCGELEEQRKKHEHDAAQDDDVLVLLDKERERLKSEVN